jgi:LytS/YehU family sensor histidine kinase
VTPRAIWAFVAGDSRLAPLGVALAVGLAAGLVRFAPGAGAWIGAAFVATIAAGLVAGVFERTS